METDIVQIVRDEFSLRIEKNPRYSMRAFAKSLDLNIGSLSRLLNGKRRLTPEAASQLCNKLELSPAKKSEILFSLLSTKGSPSLDQEYDLNHVQIQEEVFELFLNGITGLFCSWSEQTRYYGRERQLDALS